MYSGSGTTSDTNSTAGDWSTWLLLAGRGFGKTRTGAEMVFHAVENIRDVISRIVWSEDEKKGAVPLETQRANWNDHLVEKGGGSQQYQNSPRYKSR